MADDTNTTPGDDAPGVLRTGANGEIPDIGGRQAWVWMQDTDDGGGGRFDVRSDRVPMWLRKGCRVVPDYPLHFGPSARHAKTQVGRPGRTIDAPGGLVAAGGAALGLPAPGPEPSAVADEQHQAAGQPADGEPDTAAATVAADDNPDQPTDTGAEKTTTRKARTR